MPETRETRRRRRRTPAISAEKWCLKTPRHHSPAPSRRTKPRKSIGVLRRYSSEPILWTVRIVSAAGGGEISDEPAFLPRHQTYTDIFSHSLPVLLPPPSASLEEMKVVVSVTVEGSPGPVRAMVRLGGKVEEAIAAVVERYGREGRSPTLDLKAGASFELHHSHFSLQSNVLTIEHRFSNGFLLGLENPLSTWEGLNKSDKIGDVGGRSFYLRKTCDGNSFKAGSEGSRITAGDCEIELIQDYPPAAVPSHLFFSFITKRLSKIGRHTRKLLKVVGCFPCQ